MVLHLNFMHGLSFVRFELAQLKIILFQKKKNGQPTVISFDFALAEMISCQ